MAEVQVPVAESDTPPAAAGGATEHATYVEPDLDPRDYHMPRMALARAARVPPTRAARRGRRASRLSARVSRVRRDAPRARTLAAPRAVQPARTHRLQRALPRPSPRAATTRASRLRCASARAG
jgi:hypothetical protein